LVSRHSLFSLQDVAKSNQNTHEHNNAINRDAKKEASEREKTQMHILSRVLHND